MSVVVDASVAVRWYLPEGGAERAAEILSRSDELIAPDLVLAEIGSAVWQRVRKKEVSTADAIEIVERAGAAFTTLTPITEVATEAMRLSVGLNHPIYDCLYLALAQRDDVPLVTADTRLASLADQVGLEVQLLT